MKIFSFPPISNANSKVLILGTMPGKRSLAMSQYYAHGGNHFWKILFELFEHPFSKSYDDRVKLAIDNGVAIWDVLMACERVSSADADIVKEVPNDFDKFFRSQPNIRAVFFNGKNAEAYFNRYGILSPVPTYTLPSTSPGNGWYNYEQKRDAFQKILQMK